MSYTTGRVLTLLEQLRQGTLLESLQAIRGHPWVLFPLFPLPVIEQPALGLPLGRRFLHLKRHCHPPMRQFITIIRHRWCWCPQIQDPPRAWSNFGCYGEGWPDRDSADTFGFYILCRSLTL